MDLKRLRDVPPWDWPTDAAATLLAALRDDGTKGSDRLLAAELAGDYTVVNDEIAAVLLDIVAADGEADELRGVAAISLGPALEHADTVGFDDADDILLSEETVARIQRVFRRLFNESDVPVNVRRRILEASVRAQQDWHPDAVAAAHAGGDADWLLTSVFCMRFVRGFDGQILSALESPDPELHYHAICAAGNWELDAAWAHVVGIATSGEAERPLRLAAIDALSTLRPREAIEILGDLTDADDDEIADAAFEALALAEGLAEDDLDQGAADDV